MHPDLVGADVPALRGFVTSLRRRGAQIDTTRQRLDAVIAGLPWAGPDRDAFVDAWRRVHAASLVRITHELGGLAAQVAAHADRQERASRASAEAAW